MKLAIAAIAAFATLVLPAATPASSERVLGVDSTVLGMRLAWYDPATLTRLPGRTVPLVNHGGAWSLSPDRTRLAIGGSFAAGDVRIIDVKRMRTVGVVRLGARGRAESLAWLRGNRLLAVGISSLAVIDTKHLRVLRRAALPGFRYRAIPVPDGIAVMLEQTTSDFSAAKVALASVDGIVGTVTLDRITIGFRRTGDTFETRSGGFAVDPTTQRAFVVGADDTIAAVDLHSLVFAYHGGSSRSLAKPLPGPQRTARWLGDGLLAVAGNNGFAPTGLRIVDTRDWSSRVLDRESESVALAGGIVVGSNSTEFVGYAGDGTRRYGLGLASGEDLQIAGRYGYICHGTTLRVVFDLSTGSPTGNVHGPICVTVLAG